MKNVKRNRILLITFITAFVFSIIFNIITIQSLAENRSINRQYREREQEYERTIKRLKSANREASESILGIRECSTEIGKSLQRQYSSIGELRDTIREIRKKYEEMEEYISRLDNSTDIKYSD